MGIEPVKQIVRINNRNPRGFNSYYKSQAKVHHISEIRYEKQMDKYVENLLEKPSWFIVLKNYLIRFFTALRIYLQIITFFGSFLLLGGCLEMMVVK
jgi:hypothetical protein